VVVDFQTAKYVTEVCANANGPKFGVIFDIFVEGDKVGAAEILDDVVWHSSCIEYVKEGAEGGKVWVYGFFVGVREALGSERKGLHQVDGISVRAWGGASPYLVQGAEEILVLWEEASTWHGGKLSCGGLRVWIVLDTGWVQLFLHG
jgi:hypothetical protein